MRNTIFVFLWGLLVIIGCNGCGDQPEDEWVNLFNGEDLTGWEQLNGSAEYSVVDGELVGTTVMNSPNSFLCTKEKFSDFVFELEMYMVDDFNSGIQFRSESKPDYLDGRVHGYQCEVDPSPRAWSAGIYDESRRGWLYPVDLNPSAKFAFKKNDWNHYRIECIGPSIKTWLNGVPVAHLIDDLTPEGFIALQVHAIRADSLANRQIKWRNIRIKTTNLKPSPDEEVYVVNMLPNDLSTTEKNQGYELLFDGKTPSQFKSLSGDDFPDKGWKVENGTLQIIPHGGDPDKRGGDILTREDFEHFELKFDFLYMEGANSGIKYRIQDAASSVGLEYQILDDESHHDATKDPTGNRTLASVFDLIPAQKESRFVNGVGKWNRGRIVFRPDHQIEHWLNGRKVLEYTLGSSSFKEAQARSSFANVKDFGMSGSSPILIQDFVGEVHFRSLKIKKL